MIIQETAAIQGLQSQIKWYEPKKREEKTSRLQAYLEISTFQFGHVFHEVDETLIG